MGSNSHLSELLRAHSITTHLFDVGKLNNIRLLKMAANITGIISKYYQ